MSSLTAAKTSSAAGEHGIERQRRLPDGLTLEVLAEVGMDGWTVADVLRRHDATRRHICQRRREMRRKGLWPQDEAPVFLPAEVASKAEAGTAPRETAAEITVVLRRRDR